MKNPISFTLIGFLSLIFSGCSTDDNKMEEENFLLGSWQLVQAYSNPGAGAGEWNYVEDGYIYSFSETGEFSSTRFQDCTTGSFTSEFSLLVLDFGCDGFSAGIEDPEGVFVEKYNFEGQFLVLTPTYLSCDEGCGFKFRKIRK